MNTIHSLSYRAYIAIVSSDWIYPSRCELHSVEDKGSLQESLGPNFPNFHLLPNRPMKAAASFVARAIAFIAMPIIGLIGVVYHGAQAVKQLFFLIPLLSSDKALHKEKLSQHFAACKQDFRSFLQIHYPAGAIFVSAVSKALFYYSFSVAIPLLTRIGILVLACSTGLTALAGVLIWLFLTVLIEPSNRTEDFIDSHEEAIALAKSICLRRDFGVVSESGQLLTHSKETDLEDSELTSHFGQVLCTRALDVLKEIQRLQENLPEAVRLQPESQINKNAILAHLREQTLPQSNAGFDYEEWVKNFEQLHFGIEQLAQCLNHCGYIKGVPIKITPIPYPEDYIRQFFIPNVTPIFHEPFDWEEFLDTKVICVLQSTDGNCSALYKTFKERVLAKAHPLALLQLPEGSVPEAKAVREVIHELLLKIHPDKVDPELHKEAAALFICLKKAEELVAQILATNNPTVSFVTIL